MKRSPGAAPARHSAMHSAIHAVRQNTASGPIRSGSMVETNRITIITPGPRR